MLIYFNKSRLRGSDNCPKIMYIIIIDARDIHESNVAQMMNC